VFAPVFYGYRDTEAVFPPVVKPVRAGTATSASGVVRPVPGRPGHPLRIFYPSVDGSPEDAPLLTGCGRYPLVVLAHGSCPVDEHAYRTWFELPATLARSGFVVMVPDLPLTRGGRAPSQNEAEQAVLRNVVGWARSTWEHREVLMPPPATALVGHSFGAGLSARVAAARPSRYAAHVSLSGVEYPGSLRSSRLPKLLTWGTGTIRELPAVPVSDWEERLAAPAHVMELVEGGHWDYLPEGRSGCDAEPDGTRRRGTCPQTWAVAAGVVACFLTRYLRPENVPRSPWPDWLPLPSPYRVPVSLRPPTLLLTDEQRLFAGGHLQAWQAITGHDDCGVRLSWKTASRTGSLTHG
jgi:dienelactone hydrolase